MNNMYTNKQSRLLSKKKKLKCVKLKCYGHEIWYGIDEDGGSKYLPNADKHLPNYRRNNPVKSHIIYR